MKKPMLMLVRMLPLPFTANIAKTGDFDDALATYQNGDYATAFKLFKPLAEQGNTDAQYNLGLMYHTGQGVIQDYKEAVKWYRLSADQGYALAQTNLGFMYGSGKGLKKDDKEATKWYRLAADQGDAEAQNSLGWKYQNGEGVIQDDKKAHMWWNIAYANGHDKADHNINIITQRMTPADIATAEDMARQCLASNYQDC